MNSYSRLKFGSKCEVSDGMIEIINNLGIIDDIVSSGKFKATQELEKQMQKVQCRDLYNPKLDDANLAGKRGKQAKPCTLILTEGDSAKAFAVSGISVVGRDTYGVFPLRGKVLNVTSQSKTNFRK